MARELTDNEQIIGIVMAVFCLVGLGLYTGWYLSGKQAESYQELPNKELTTHFCRKILDSKYLSEQENEDWVVYSQSDKEECIIKHLKYSTYQFGDVEVSNRSF